MSISAYVTSAQIQAAVFVQYQLKYNEDTIKDDSAPESTRIKVQFRVQIIHGFSNKFLSWLIS